MVIPLFAGKRQHQMMSVFTFSCTSIQWRSIITFNFGTFMLYECLAQANKFCKVSFRHLIQVTRTYRRSLLLAQIEEFLWFMGRNGSTCRKPTCQIWWPQVIQCADSRYWTWTVLVTDQTINHWASKRSCFLGTLLAHSQVFIQKTENQS